MLVYNESIRDNEYKNINIIEDRMHYLCNIWYTNICILNQSHALCMFNYMYVSVCGKNLHIYVYHLGNPISMLHCHIQSEFLVKII